MVRQQNVSFTPTLRVFISKVITPVVLVAGVLFLIVFNFKGVLKTVQTNEDRFQGIVSYSQGPLSYRFSETSGIDRPDVRINNQDLISFAEWSSSISVDGTVQELWNSGHGYSYDDNNREMFNTVNGSGWQFIETVTLVDDRTVKVSFQFAARPTSSKNVPVHYVFDIAHQHTWWYQYNLSNNNSKFTAQLSNTSTPNPATVSLQVTGDAAQNPQLRIDGSGGSANGAGVSTTTGGLISEYTIDNPTPDQVITLGTETITYDPGSTNPGSGNSSLVPLPKP